MSTQERDVARIREVAIMGISALYTGAQNSVAQDLIRRAGEAVADQLTEQDGKSISTEGLEDLMLERIYDQKERGEVRERALRHAKGVLVGQRRSPERDERLGIVNQKLSNLNR